MEGVVVDVRAFAAGRRVQDMQRAAVGAFSSSFEPQPRAFSPPWTGMRSVSSTLTGA